LQVADNGKKLQARRTEICKDNEKTNNKQKKESAENGGREVEPAMSGMRKH
jgi:hypothetical protein